MLFGTAIHNLEITFGKCGQLDKVAGAILKLIVKEGKSAALRLPIDLASNKKDIP